MRTRELRRCRQAPQLMRENPVVTEMCQRIDCLCGRREVLRRFGADVYNCEVIGKLPTELEGMLYLAGPDIRCPTLSGGNGGHVISAFKFRNGKASFRCRHARSESPQDQRDASRRPHGIYRKPRTHVNALFHHGKLFAMREDSLPCQIDPDTLATLPKWDFRGRLKSRSLTAHPKVDPVTGEWWSCSAFALGTREPDMALQVIDERGDLVREEFFRAPYAGITHDFAVTREHVVFPVMPLKGRAARICSGAGLYPYAPQRPSLWGIMRRNAHVESIRWFTLCDCLSADIMNAHTEGDVVHVDAMLSWRIPPPSCKAAGSSPADVTRGIAQLTRLSFYLLSPSGTIEVTPFQGALGEMPRCDPRRMMSKYRYGYIKTRDGLARLDWETGELVQTTLGRNTQEPVFVPCSPAGREGEGFVLTMVDMPAEGRAELHVLDAMHLERAPLALVRLPFEQPTPFYGNFVRRSECPPDPKLRRTV